MNNLLNIKSFFEFLKKNKSYTFIDVFGLSLSLMFVILIATYTVQELSTDQFHENKDRIYAVASEKTFGTAYRISDRLLERYPEIEKSCAMTDNFKSQPVAITDNEFKADLLLADTTFFSMFSFPLIKGDSRTVLESPNYVVLSESFARKAFPDTDPLGGIIIIKNQSWVVSGVMKEIKNSAIPACDILLRMDNVKLFNSNMDDQHFSNAGSSIIYLQTKSGTNIQARAEDAAEYFREIFWLYKRDIYTKVHFVPLTEVYFSDIQTGYLVNQGDWTFVIVLMSIGILILLFAIINYINLTVAQTGFRAKEMATRQLLGSSRMEIFLRLILESTLLTFISFVIGVILAFIFLPAANRLLETKLDIVGMISPFVLLITLLVLLIMGVLAGLLPAVIISGTKPISIVKGAFRTQTKMVFSKFFIVFQNLITITLIGICITMIWQINHLIKAPLGYNTANIIDISVMSLDNEKAKTLANELSQLSSVKRVAFSEGNPQYLWNNNTTVVNGNNVGFQCLIVDPTFVDMYGIRIIKDNMLGDPDARYLSMQAIREMEMTMDDLTVHADGWSFPIAGVIEDIYLQNINFQLQPVSMQIKEVEQFPMGIWNLSVETQGDASVAFQQVKRRYERITLLNFEGDFLDRMVTKSFATQKRLSDIVMVFAFIAALISMLGLLAMSTYFIQQRTREIAVRKVFGSTDKEILIRVVGGFLMYVGIAFAFSIPVIWYLGDRWLSVYTYRIPLSPLIFIGAGLICLLLSFLTVYSQSWRAASANPALSIKTE